MIPYISNIVYKYIIILLVRIFFINLDFIYIYLYSFFIDKMIGLMIYCYICMTMIYFSIISMTPTYFIYYFLYIYFIVDVLVMVL